MVRIGAAAMFGLMMSLFAVPAAAGPGDDQLAAASQAQQYAYLVFSRGADDATRQMQATVQAQVERSGGRTVMVPVSVGDPANAALVARYDAQRMPLPCVMGIAPNGAVTGVYPLTVTPEQLDLAVLTPRYSEMVKGLQEQKIAVLCLQPANAPLLPPGVSQLAADPTFRGRMFVVTVQADDPQESRFFDRMRVKTDLTSPVTMVFAPPGAFVGKFDAQATGAMIAQKLHESGRCNCEHCQRQRK